MQLKQKHGRQRGCCWIPQALNNISKLEINRKLKGHLLLKQFHLDSNNYNLIDSTADKNQCLQTLPTSLQNAFHT